MFRSARDRDLEMTYAQQLLQGNRLEDTVCDTAIVKQIATDKVPQRLYMRSGSVMTGSLLVRGSLSSVI